MEPQVLSHEQIEWEARRVAAAFGFEHPVRSDPDHRFYMVHAMNVHMMWLHQGPGCHLHKLWLCKTTFSQDSALEYEQPRMVSSYDGRKWHLGDYQQDTHDTDGHLARGLYRLGFEDESILSQLPALSAHEKLELRLSMPREFWPQKWLDEETPAHSTSSS